MATAHQQYDEVRVYDQIAERTGTLVDRTTVRNSKHLCRSVRDLARKVRQLGDGYYYLPVSLWPEGETQIVLSREWTTMG